MTSNIQPSDFFMPSLVIYPGGETGLTRLEAIDQAKCVTCPTEGPVEFRDQLSVKEYNITGMCQECQDDMYDHINGAGTAGEGCGR
ncbi:MAG TPA: hypothetical protein VFK94_02850 [Patescibacteria group bacterium]|nr:hypothetical protein [Patescibacteria group bacterium]